ncbi:hypothetical protein ABGB18_36300 [Nonomuraea sp. B12E4]|uniref:hypothetical protein n=1 Tax=Nonomuraea sp. B12E4 TaxID=3153564 RepID=UPI00325ECFC7
MTDWHDVREELRAFALGLPETHEDHPWGETVIKVNKKRAVKLLDAGRGGLR